MYLNMQIFNVVCVLGKLFLGYFQLLFQLKYTLCGTKYYNAKDVNRICNFGALRNSSLRQYVPSCCSFCSMRCWATSVCVSSCCVGFPEADFLSVPPCIVVCSVYECFISCISFQENLQNRFQKYGLPCSASVLPSARSNRANKTLTFVKANKSLLHWFPHEPEVVARI